MLNNAQFQNQSALLFGRRNEIAALTTALRGRKSCLVVGPKGIGKTRLIDESLSISQQPFVTVESPQVLHRLLVKLAERLSCPTGRIGSLREATSISLNYSVVEALRKAPQCVILENVTDTDPRMYRFLQQLYYVPGVCLIVTSKSRGCLGHLHKLLWDPREEIALKPLTRTEALGLFEAASNMYGLQSCDLDEFRAKVLSAAQGNPGQIVTMCRLACRPEYQSGRNIMFVPLRIDAFAAFV